MALQIDYQFKLNGVTWKSGEFYTFNYQAWSNDPKPLIILFYRIRGINPKTGHQFRLLQGINMNYIPRSHRRLFLMQWQNYYETSNGNIKFTYEMMKKRFPWLKFGIRRYMTKPVYYIKNITPIPMDQVEDAVLSSFDKDFSKKVALELVQKHKRVMSRTKVRNKKTKSGIGQMIRNMFRGPR